MDLNRVLKRNMKQMSYLEKCQYPQPLWKRKLNLNWDLILSKLEWLRSRKELTKSGGENSGEKGTLVHYWWDYTQVQAL